MISRLTYRNQIHHTVDAIIDATVMRIRIRTQLGKLVTSSTGSSAASSPASSSSKSPMGFPYMSVRLFSGIGSMRTPPFRLRYNMP